MGTIDGLKEVDSNSNKAANPKAWVFSTYFAEGLPYSIVRLMSSVFFTDIGLKERYIGYLNFLGVPWNLKFLWAPLVDIFGTRRRWMIAAQVLISLLTAALALVCFLIPESGDHTFHIGLVTAFLIGLAFLSATNDIAVDAYYMEGLPDSSMQAAYTGFRVFAYRIAMILARSGFVGIAAFAAASVAGGANPYRPWGYAFGAAALTMSAVTLFHIFFAPHFEKQRDKTEKTRVSDVMRKFKDAFVDYTRQEKFLLIILFIIFYKVGDEILFSMSTPFLMRELAVTKGQMSWLSGILGAAGSIIGTSLGGLWIKRKGFKSAIWPLTILMNFNIWAYVWLAYARPLATDPTGLSIIAGIHAYESIAAGLGNAVLVVYILRTCNPQFKASHYAIGSAIMSLFGTFFGGSGGLLVEKMGYLNLFILSFFATIPSMALLFWVPMKEPAATAPAKN